MKTRTVPLKVYIVFLENRASHGYVLVCAEDEEHVREICRKEWICSGDKDGSIITDIEPFTEDTEEELGETTTELKQREHWPETKGQVVELEWEPFLLVNN